MSINSYILTYAWIPFASALCLIFLLAGCYVYRMKSRRISVSKGSWGSSLISTLTLTVAICLPSLVSIDIFLISFMKDDHGEFKEWAQELSTRHYIMSTITNAYYAIYCILIALAFLFIPFTFFFYQLSDEMNELTVAKRILKSLKFTLIFIVIIVVLFLIGFLTPQAIDARSQTVNNTKWQNFEHIISSLSTNKGEDALSFIIGVMASVGWLFALSYMAYGMVCHPIHIMFHSFGSMIRRKELNQELLDSTRMQVESFQNRSGALNRTDRDILSSLRSQEREYSHLQGILDNSVPTGSNNKALRCCYMWLSILQIIFGICMLAIFWLFIISLLLSNIDRLLHSDGAGTGYILTKVASLVNPLNFVLLQCEKIFPIDYIVVLGIVLLMFFCTLSSIETCGIRCLCIKLIPVRRNQTTPQSLVLMSFIMIFVAMVIVLQISQVAPQYTTFGSQQYVVNISTTLNDLPDFEFNGQSNFTTILTSTLPSNFTATTIKTCSIEASSDVCTMSALSIIILKFCMKMMIFNCFYFWASWAFIAIFIVSHLVVIYCVGSSPVNEEEESEIFEEDDNEPLISH